MFQSLNLEDRTNRVPFHMTRPAATAICFALLLIAPMVVDPIHAKASPAGVKHEGKALVVTDSAGRTHRFEQRPQRFAACSSFAVETLMALGVEPVARFDVRPVYPPKAEKVPIVGASHSTGPDVEKLIAVRSDVILLHDVFLAFADTLQKTVGVPVITHQVKSLDDVRTHIKMLGELTGKTDAADRLLNDVNATLAWVDAQPTPKRAPRVLSLFGTNDAWYAHRANSFMGSLLHALGAENVAANADAHERYRSLAPIDLEQVIAEDPDVVFIIPYNGADPKVIEEFMAHPAFKSLRAVRNGRAHLMESTIYTSHAGPRAGEALRRLYHHLWPDRPQPPPHTAQARP